MVTHATRKGKSMSMTKEQILTEAMALDPRDRDEIAQTLWQSADPREFTAEQIREHRRRIDDLDAAQTRLIPGEQVMEELRKQFRR
jgi:putative addiction module component (TIGR02574 family)